MTAATATSAGGPPIRDAAAVVLVRRDRGAPRVLMGRRGSAAVFMPSKMVFPGGAVDPDDVALGADLALDAETERRLALHAAPALARGLAFAAVRELWEEAGLALARPGPGAGLAARAPALAGLAARDLVPDGSGLRFVFRAVTPPGRPRRFDARFFLVDAEALAGDPDDFAAAGDELSDLGWLPLAEARALGLAFITEVVLSEVAALLAAGDAPRPVPFFHHDAAGSHVSLL